MNTRPRSLMWVDWLMFFLGLGLVFSLSSAGAQDKTTGETGQTWEDRLEHSSRSAADLSLTAAVKTALHLSGDVATMPIQVNTLNGVVTLTGKVQSPRQQVHAGELAAKTPGVKSVVNKLLIDKNVKPTRPAEMPRVEQIPQEKK